jgi:hypothetical protein
MTPYMQYRQDLKNGSKPDPEKKRKKIKQVSKKREKANREYAKKSRPRWMNRQCDIRAPGCTGTAQGIHHKKGKSSIELLLDMQYWIPACNHCNLWVEVHDRQARELGFKLPRLH